MRIVLDASAALRLVMRMEDADAMADRLETASLVLSPGLFQGETANALWKYVRAGRITPDQALIRLDEALSLVDLQIPDAELVTESLSAACRYGHPVYDLLYAVAARRHAGVVLTRDRWLVELLREMDIPIVEL